jgi:hypothetical protein
LESVTENHPGYRIGSPFADQPSPSDGDNAAERGPAAVAGDAVVWAVEPLGEGVWRQTAASAAFSAAMLVGFATLCWLFFPVGGIAITALGFVVSMIGLSSRWTKLSTAAMILHGGLFMACYLRAI